MWKCHTWYNRMFYIQEKLFIYWWYIHFFKHLVPLGTKNPSTAADPFNILCYIFYNHFHYSIIITIWTSSIYYLNVFFFLRVAMLRLYKYPGVTLDTQKHVLDKINTLDSMSAKQVEIECCFYVACKSKTGNNWCCLLELFQNIRVISLLVCPFWRQNEIVASVQIILIYDDNHKGVYKMLKIQIPILTKHLLTIFC